MQKPHTFHYARIIDKNVQMILFPESKNTYLYSAQQTNTTNKNIREKLLSRLTDRMKIRQIELQENSLSSRLVFQLCDRLIAF
jgi:hypothetical protein